MIGLLPSVELWSNSSGCTHTTGLGILLLLSRHNNRKSQAFFNFSFVFFFIKSYYYTIMHTRINDNPSFPNNNRMVGLPYKRWENTRHYFFLFFFFFNAANFQWFLIVCRLPSRPKQLFFFLKGGGSDEGGLVRQGFSFYWLYSLWLR